jgi:hypothetical protein
MQVADFVGEKDKNCFLKEQSASPKNVRLKNGHIRLANMDKAGVRKYLNTEYN